MGPVWATVIDEFIPGKMSAFHEPIVVHRTGHLGDAICSIRAVRRIRAAFPTARLILLCDEPDEGNKVAFRTVAGWIQCFDEICTYHSLNGLMTLVSLRNEIRRLQPAQAIILPQVRETIHRLWWKRLFFHLAGVPRVLGCQHFVDVGVVRPNEPARLELLLDIMGIPRGVVDADLPGDPLSFALVQERLDSFGIGARDGYIVLCPGGKCATQRWPLERYRDVVEALCRSTRLWVVVIGSPSELEACRSVFRDHPKVRILSGLPLKSIVELLRQAYCYLGNDTGPMHVAAAVGCPVIVVMSGRNAEGMWDPDVSPRLVIREAVGCGNCFLSECHDQKLRCLTQISADRVIGLAEHFLDSAEVKDSWERRLPCFR